MTRNALALALALVLFFASCKVQDPLYCDLDHPCTDPERPFCDLGGEFPASGGIGRTCIGDPGGGTAADAGVLDAAPPDGAPIACDSPGEALECAGDTLVVCAEDRQEQRIACPLGCLDEELRCLDLDPSNGLEAYLDRAAEAQPLEFTGEARFDTDSGNLVDAGGRQLLVQSVLLDAPDDGVAIRVIVARSVDIGSLIATGTPALALVADGEIVIRGRLSVASNGSPGGAGAGRRFTSNGCSAQRGAQEELEGVIQQGGHGGGGHATPGGSGGAIEGLAAGGTGGSATGHFAIIPLAGGCAGAGGGSGGGAVQLASRTKIQIPTGAVISANGAGGSEPLPGPGNKYPAGGGGGAGGAILLEAPNVEVLGGLFANGGGGAGLCAGDGEDGREDLTRAAGRDCADPGFGDGGAGGSAMGPPTSGASLAPDSSDERVGGSGGGAVGRIRINSRYGTFLPDPSALISPGAAVGEVRTR